MLRIDEINMTKLTQDEQKVLLNACLAAANHQFLSEAATTLESRLDAGVWFIYKGGHHIAVGKKGRETTPALKVFELSDAFLSMVGFPDYLCEERLALGISLVGSGN